MSECFPSSFCSLCFSTTYQPVFFSLSLSHTHTGYSKRARSTKESRLSSILEGRDDNYKHGHRNKEKVGSLSNKEKEKGKHHMMIKKGKRMTITKMTSRQRTKNTKLKEMRRGEKQGGKTKGMKKHKVSGKRNRK
jgi:hypothetical protein